MIMAKENEKYLTQLPKFSHLIPSILFKKSRQYQLDTGLPQVCLRVNSVHIDRSLMKAFNKIVSWSNISSLHPGYLHTIAFPLHLKLMLQEQFPFSILGLVHLTNTIEQYELVDSSQNLDISCQFGEVKQLEIGYLFTINTQFYLKQKCVIQAQHQYLKRKIKALKSTHQPMSIFETQSVGQTELWSLKSELGRRYARCAGDYNPIHLHPISAKLLGFKRHIIHGMWLKSRVFSALVSEQRSILEQPYGFAVEFKKPVYLPNVVQFQRHNINLSSSKQGVDFKVISDAINPPIEHLTGRLTW
jgi:acyl dehydratase